MKHLAVNHPRVNSQTSFKSSGEVVTIKAYYVNRGKFEGEECDLVRVEKSNGMREVVESPLLTL